LRLDLRSALREAIETRRAATRDTIAFETDHHVEHVSVSVEPLPSGADGRSAFLIAFEEKELSKDEVVDLGGARTADLSWRTQRKGVLV